MFMAQSRSLPPLDSPPTQSFQLRRGDLVAKHTFPPPPSASFPVTNCFQRKISMLSFKFIKTFFCLLLPTLSTHPSSEKWGGRGGKLLRKLLNFSLFFENKKNFSIRFLQHQRNRYQNKRRHAISCRWSRWREGRMGKKAKQHHGKSEFTSRSWRGEEENFPAALRPFSN